MKNRQYCFIFGGSLDNNQNFGWDDDEDNNEIDEELGTGFGEFQNQANQ